MNKIILKTQLLYSEMGKSEKKVADWLLRHSEEAIKLSIIELSEKTGASELSPEKILQDFLRRLWMEAVRRRQGELPAASSPENDVVRLQYSTLIRKLQRGDWERVSALMRTAANVTKEMPDCIPVLISTNGGT